MNGNNYIFISYAHKDAKTVYPILEQMKKDGYRVWLDNNIKAGTKWDETIAVQ
ncbi:MAG: toll/interleukin-1 receptor domain-containing protein [Clostridia bacterium]|nr:toll/interleukin-1 receptor domain-containing protein [Clostridia bacterium]